jgi:hypothetical protein
MQSNPLSGRNERNYLMFALVPPVLVAVLFAAGFFKERRAARFVHAALGDLNADQRMSLASLYSGRHDAPAGTRTQDAWSRLELAAEEMDNRLSYFSRGLPIEIVPPGAEWEQAAFVEKIVEDSAPIYEQLDVLIELDDPTVSLRSLERLMLAKLRVAIFEDDSDQAVQVLKRIRDLADRASPNYGNPNQLLAEHRNAILQTLAVGFWQNPDHLRSLRSQVSKPMNLDEYWRTMTQNQRAAIQSYIGLVNRSDDLYRFNGDLTPYEVPGEALRYWLGTIELSDTDQKVGSNEHFKQIRSLDDEKGGFRTMTITGIPFADGRSYELGWMGSRLDHIAFAIADHQYQQHVTLTLIAIKQFQLDTGRWPSDLSELGNIGSGFSDSYVRSPNHFSYGVSPDSSEAWLQRPSTNHDIDTRRRTLSGQIPDYLQGRPRNGVIDLVR